jgi:type II secretory pathway component PulF
MAKDERRFDYVAVDPSGRRIRGSLAALSDQLAFEQLKQQGLSPIWLTQNARLATQARPQRLTDQQCAEFLSDLSALLAAGSDMRTSIAILGGRGGDRHPVRAVSRALAADIGGGGSVEGAFAAQLGKNGPLVAALISAGDLVGGLRRAADMLQARLRLREQLISALSYPTFVALSTVLALGVIILFVVPALAPLVSEVGGHPPMILGLLIEVSDFVRTRGGMLGLLALVLVGLLLLAARLGLLIRALQQLGLDGPARRTTSGFVFGAFAIALGNMLSSGAPISEALRLAIRSTPWRSARERLEPVAQAVRQGQTVSSALEAVKGFPDSIARLAAVGEVSGALGPMLARGGKLEEDAAIKRIEAAGRVLGPALIVGLGAIIGLIMGGLLTGVSQLGQGALQ